ncbi:MAG: GntR family transcriptional regulator [Alphaproteobacteria bacterium]|nr:GntR family transcriptional regulator [Alphaproteobacteria bacterium]
MTSGRGRALRAIEIARRPALAAIVEERLRDAIMFGELGLGEAISEDRLATMLGVSRTPVREALTSLQLQGLIVIQPQRGSHVFRPTEEDLADICAYRRIMEVQALTLAMDRAGADTIAALEAAQTAMERADGAGDHEAVARADAAFHNAALERCGNRLLIQAYSLVSGRVGAIRFFARRSSGTKTHASAQHRAIIAALRSNSLDEAHRIISLHIMNMEVHFAEAQAAARSTMSPDRASAAPGGASPGIIEHASHNSWSAAGEGASRLGIKRARLAAASNRG